jgi:hypothetical protein
MIKLVYDKKMDGTIFDIIRSYYPDLTEKELEICKGVTIHMWSLLDMQDDIANGYI